jgi:hypothetical protein
MSTKLALTAATLVALFAGQALAHGQKARPVPANAYASAGVAVPAPAPLSDAYQGDFQLQGRF